MKLGVVQNGPMARIIQRSCELSEHGIFGKFRWLIEVHESTVVDLYSEVTCRINATGVDTRRTIKKIVQDPIRCADIRSNRLAAIWLVAGVGGPVRQFCKLALAAQILISNAIQTLHACRLIP